VADRALVAEGRAELLVGLAVTRLDDRKALCGILSCCTPGIQREQQELGFGPGTTCWRRPDEWNRAGVWQRLHELLLAELHGVGKLDWSHAMIDSSHVQARQTRPKSGPSPVDRARPGSRHHVLTEGARIPLSVSLTDGNCNDVTQLVPLIDDVPPVRGRRVRPRRRPDNLFADRPSTTARTADSCGQRHPPRIARRGRAARVEADTAA
jgi:transposase